jgi:hypothetical protein
VILRTTAVVHVGFSEHCEQTLLLAAGQFRATWADVNVALLIEDEIGPAKGAIGTCRLIPHRYVRCDVAIHQL